MKLLRQLRALFHRDRLDADMSEEMRAHLELQAAENERRGMAPEEARYAALRSFGGVEQVKERARDQRGWRWLDRLRADLRFAFRLLLRQPGFTATALLTLTLCLGVNLTIFAVVDGVLLRPLPLPEAHRLVTVFNSYPQAGIPRYGTSVTSYYERRGRIPAFSSLAMLRETMATIGEPGATQREKVVQISPEFFSVLGVGPAQGRVFTDVEMAPKADGVAIVAHEFWRTRLNARADVLQSSVQIEGTPRRIVAVLPPGFRFLSGAAQVYLPLVSGPADRAADMRHGGTPTTMIARLAPGATLGEAQAQIDAHNAAVERGNPLAKLIAETGFHSQVAPLRADHVAPVRPTLVLLQAGSILLLAIGAVNVGNLLLIRAAARLKELAIRQSLGASPGQIAAQVVTETGLLTALGGVGGVLLGAWGIEWVRTQAGDRLPLATAIVFDARVAFVAFVGAIALGLLLSAPIALHNVRAHLAYALHSETRGGTASRAAQRWRHGFIVAQIALAFVLLVGAGLLGLSLRRALAVSPGFRSAQLLSAQVALLAKGYPHAADGTAFTARLLGELSRQPGVEAAGLSTNIPFGGMRQTAGVTVLDRPRPAGESVRAHDVYGVSGDYFATLGIPLRTGRLVTTDDSVRNARVCVVDEDFARYYWPSGNALGQQLGLGDEVKREEAFIVVGVVGAVKHDALTDRVPTGAVYFPFAALYDNSFFVVTRTVHDAAAFAATLRRLVRSADPEVPVNDVRSVDARISDSLLVRRSAAQMIRVFSIAAIVLTAVGTYGVLAYAVSQRRREIAVRLALGARPDQIRRQVLGTGSRLVAAGLLLGLAGSWLAGRAMQGVLFEVPGWHAATLASAVLVVTATALVACLIPAQRAATLPPIEALRNE